MEAISGLPGGGFVWEWGVETAGVESAGPIPATPAVTVFISVA